MLLLCTCGESDECGLGTLRNPPPGFLPHSMLNSEIDLKIPPTRNAVTEAIISMAIS